MKKKSIKVISFTLAVALIISMFSMISFAADIGDATLSITPSKSTTCNVGDTETFVLSVNHPGNNLGAFQFCIDYDTTYWEFVNGGPTDDFIKGDGSNYTDYTPDDPNLPSTMKELYIAWSFGGKEIPAGKSDVATITLKAKPDAQTGKTSFPLDASSRNIVKDYDEDYYNLKYTSPVIAVKGVTKLQITNKPTSSLNVNDTLQLKTDVIPNTEKITWSTTDPKVATVDASNVLKAVGPGKATITAKTTYDTDSFDVNVILPAKSITLDQTTLTMNKGDKKSLTATVDPKDSTDKAVFSSDTPSVATVDKDSGLVTAVGGGHAVITATAGTQKATCAVTVNVPATGIDLPATFVVGVNSSATINASIIPDDSSDTIASWDIKDTSVAKITNSTTGKVKGSATITAGATSGKTTLTVKTSNGVEKSCEIQVSAAATNVSFDKEGSTMIVGDTMPLSAITVPEVTTDKLAWTNSDSSVASFDTSTTGNKITIKALKAGSTKITVRIPNGKAATYMLTVIDNTNLKAILDKTADLSTYTKASQTASNIATIRANAQAVYDKKTAASQDDIKTATERLTKAFESLQKLATADDKAPLSKALETVKDIKNDDGKYTKSSYKKFDEARTAAKGVFDNTDASVKEVTDATATLNAAFKGLKEKAKPEKVNELKEKVDKVKEEINKLDKSKYTADSWNAVQSKLAAAEKLAADPDASAADVDAAIASVSNISEKSLTPVSKKDDHHKGDNGNGDNNGGNGTKPANTGDAIAAVGALALASAAAVVISKKKKFQD